MPKTPTTEDERDYRETFGLDNPDAVTRFEVIDNTGRVYVAWPATVDLAYQDNGRTLKVFVKAEAAATQGATPDDRDAVIVALTEAVKYQADRTCTPGPAPRNHDWCVTHNSRLPVSNGGWTFQDDCEWATEARTLLTGTSEEGGG